MAKILMNKIGRKFLVNDNDKDLHTQFGYFKKEDLKKAKSGIKVVSNTGKEFTVFDSSFIDLYKRIKRGAQIIPLKDIGLILSETAINNKSVVVDAGSGSGALACFLANIAKEVISYEIREDFVKIVEHNIGYLGLKNVKVRNKNIYDGIDEKNVDLVVLDLPEPWKAAESAKNALKVGGFLISYSPSIPQTMDFVNTIRKYEDFVYLKTSEIIEREWEIDERKVRPRSQAIGHSGFISFARKI
ncbi:MAG: methyltransferase domain-containing protein [Candidatus Woesearchaeota archaeon]|mgnify:CR=1 FL=1|jgi:tRNA (adenine57-N1/adenine58-N1)-methyltransferase|nr:methyltransferase domain-containing protein [Candidatus Woesearchaeota archaeon]MDP7622577.1 methyltransferase domain-containing protein [Candidatus Woesearchaeota archaeon]HJN57289.1 methyltransferase domain-containing protein [Candidatus Woesearchaeota archaeon]|tara:strand:+ start:18809 stop:19540 length:732 start_codon:yes stop_codon:yes gene_type:complete